jgi:protein TonB
MATVANKYPMDSGDDSLLKRIVIGVVVIAVLGLAGWGISRIKLSSGGAPKRQTVKIMLPDTPPPPPPKQEEKKPEPKEENKPTQQMEQKQVEAPPQPSQALKMEGAAGDGPSAFSSGSVSKDYEKGIANTGPGGGTNSDRAKYQFYVTSMKQQLKDAIERNLQTEEKRITVTFSLWIDSDGRIKKYELAPLGNDRAKADVEAAFDKASRDAKLPPPAADMAQPLRLRMTLLPPAS